MRIWILSFILVLNGPAQAQTLEEGPERAFADEEIAEDPKNPAVYNFDADVILGDKKTPDVLFQSGTEVIGFEALLLDRKDFNDYLRIDRRRFPDRVGAP